jgi:hypothetical protein
VADQPQPAHPTTTVADQPQPAHPTTTAADQPQPRTRTTTVADEPQPAHPTTAASDEPQPAHPTSVAVWGVPSPVAAASRFTATVGVKCSAGCPLAGQPVVVRDGTGRDLGRGTLGAEPVAGTRALYAAAVPLAAPSEPGVHVWTAAFPGAADPPPTVVTARTEPATEAAAPHHEAASPAGHEAPSPPPAMDAPAPPREAESAPRHEAATCTFSLRAVKPSGNAVTVTVVDRDTEASLADADVHLGVYRASTGADGKARIEAPAGEYELYVRSPGYHPYTDPVTVTGDAALHVAVVRVSDADLDDDQMWM